MTKIDFMKLHESDLKWNINNRIKKIEAGGHEIKDVKFENAGTGQDSLYAVLIIYER